MCSDSHLPTFATASPHCTCTCVPTCVPTRMLQTMPLHLGVYSLISLTQTVSTTSNASVGLEEEPPEPISRDVSSAPCPGNSTSSCFILLITSMNAFKSTESVSYLWYLNSSEKCLQNGKSISMKHYRARPSVQLSDA